MQTSKQTKLTDSLVATKISKENVNKLIIDYIVEEIKPLRTVETDSFNRLVTGLCPSAKVPTCVTVKDNIFDKYSTMFTTITSHILNIPFVSTTADLWSSQNRSFLGMTIHWIDKCTLERKSAAIACTRFKGGHTNDKIAAAIYDIHCRYGINLKVVRTCTDNGTNMVKAFKDYQTEIQANLTEETSDNEDDDFILNNDDMTLTDILNEYQSAQTEDDETAVVLPPHMRCCSHTINLIATTDVNKAVNFDKKYKKIHNQAMAKASALWNLTNRSTKAADTAFDILGY